MYFRRIGDLRSQRVTDIKIVHGDHLVLEAQTALSGLISVSRIPVVPTITSRFNNYYIMCTVP